MSMMSEKNNISTQHQCGKQMLSPQNEISPVSATEIAIPDRRRNASLP